MHPARGSRDWTSVLLHVSVCSAEQPASGSRLPTGVLLQSRVRSVAHSASASRLLTGVSLQNRIWRADTGGATVQAAKIDALRQAIDSVEVASKCLERNARLEWIQYADKGAAAADGLERSTRSKRAKAADVGVVAVKAEKRGACCPRAKAADDGVAADKILERCALLDERQKAAHVGVVAVEGAERCAHSRQRSEPLIVEGARTTLISPSIGSRISSGRSKTRCAGASRNLGDVVLWSMMPRMLHVPRRRALFFTMETSVESWSRGSSDRNSPLACICGGDRALDWRSIE